MKITPLPSRIFIIPVALALAASLHAQSNATPPALGLLRLKATAKANDAAPLAPGKYAVDDLSTGATTGVTKTKKDDVDLLTLDGTKEWSRPLRGSPRDVSFVSFQLHASGSTVVDIGGARLGLTLSPAGGSLQLMYDDSASGTLQWKPLNVHLGTGKYGGRTLAPLPTLTVRLDPGAGTWDLFSGSRLLADNLPMIVANKDRRQFLVRAGGEGAWLAGLVMADENPLYEDANANGIDDTFERQKRGALAATSTNASERTALAQEWKEAQRQKAPPALLVKRPFADAVVAGR